MSQQEASVFVITGGAGGMGRACARRLGKRGLVLLADIVADPLEQAAHHLRAEGLRIETQLCDVSQEESVQALAEKAHALGALGGIAHTAGLSPTMANWQQIIEVDLVGTARLLKAFLPFAEQDTAVVCIASMAGHASIGGRLASGQAAVDAMLDEPLHPDLLARLAPIITTAPGAQGPSGLAYGLAKYGVIRLCQREASAWGQRGARLVSLSPGIIQTAMGQQELAQQPAMQMLITQTPLRRQGRPEEIASAVDFLVGADASFITGCDLLVDGGVTGAISSTPPPGAHERGETV
jgi:NAD(P)-dependent dehydrogenase (short-subunit alcohol dehydrogenase family)